MKQVGVQNKTILKASWLSISAVLLLLGSSYTSILSAQEAPEEEFAGERIVHLLDEPRHRTVHNDGDLYLLDVQINPGDISLPHTHDQAILLTFINGRNGSSEGRVSVNIDYATEPVTHKVSNEGPGLLRILAFVNAGTGNANLADDRPSGLGAEPQVENPWFRSYRIELAPGEETAVQTHHFSSVVVQVAGGLIHVTRSDGITAELDAIADWEWHKPNEPYQVRNVGKEATTVVINEGRH